MEIFGLLNTPGWILSVTLIFVALILYTVWKQSLWRKQGIPGPKPIPFLGILLDFARKGVEQTNNELMKKYGEVVGIYTGSLPGLLITDPFMIKEIFIKEFPTFPTRASFFKPNKQMSDMVLFAVDDHWKFMRSTLTPTFTTGKLKNMLPMIQKCCDDLVRNMLLSTNKEGVAEVKHICGCFTLDVICRTAFGLEVNSQKEPNNEFIKHAVKGLRLNILRPFFVIGMVFPFLIETLGQLFRAPIINRGTEKFFRKTVGHLITERRNNKYENYRDFIQLMMNAHKDNEKGGELKELETKDFAEYKSRGLSENEIYGNSVLFFVAGYDTTANTLSFALYCLAIYPDIQEKLTQEIDEHIGKSLPDYETLHQLCYLDMFLSEVLRLYSIAKRIGRTNNQDITINGVFIPKGTDVAVPITALHRNPKYWPDPEKFDPERFSMENKASRPPYCYMPFGLGPRACIGMRLALTEAKLALVNLTQKFKFHTCDKTEIPLQLENGLLARPKNGVFLRIEKRK